MRHRYLGKREDLVAISVHITDIRQRVEINTRMFEATFGDLISQIGWANLELRRLKLTVEIMAETKGGLTVKEAEQEAEKHLAHEKQKQDERDKELEDIRRIKNNGDSINWKDLQELRKQCATVYRQIMFILHNDVTKTEDTDEIKNQREAAYRARASLELDFLIAMLAGLKAEQPDDIRLEEVSDVDLQARIKSLEAQITSAQKVLGDLMRSPMFHFSHDPVFIDQRRSDLEHDLRVLQLEIAALNKKLAA